MNGAMRLFSVVIPACAGMTPGEVLRMTGERQGNDA